MTKLMPSAPAERLVSFEGDVLLPLRRLRDKYLKTGNPSAASRVSALIGDTAVDLTETIACGLPNLPACVHIETCDPRCFAKDEK